MAISGKIRQAVIVNVNMLFRAVVRACVLIANGVFDHVRVERYAHRTHVPNAQSQIRGRVDLWSL